MILTNPIKLEDNLHFEPHGPELDVYWAPFKNPSIPDVLLFPGYNDKDFNVIGHIHDIVSLLKSIMNIQIGVPCETISASILWRKET